MRRRGRAPSPALLTLALAAQAWGAPPCAAQRVAVQAVHASSHNVELPESGGFGVTGEVDVRDWLLRADYVRFRDHTRKPGLVCNAPGYGCGPEEVVSSVALGSLHLGAERALRLGSHLIVGGGAGVSFSALSVTATGVSGRRAFVYTPNEGMLGYLGLVSLEVVPVPSLPVRLVGTYQAHWVRFRGCRDPSEPTAGATPFCGDDRFQELMVGLAVDLSAMRGG